MSNTHFAVSPRIWLTPLVVAIIATALTGCGSSGSSGSPGSANSANVAGTPAHSGTITIAGVAPFSGPFATSTQSLQHTWNVALQQLNAAGGIDGKKVVMVVKDDQYQPNLTVQYVRQYMNDGIHVFWVMDTAAEEAIKPLMATKQIIVFTQNPPDIQGDPKQFPFGFNFYAQNSQAVKADVAWAKQHHWTKWAIVSDSSGEFQDYVHGTQALASSAGANVVLNQAYDPSTTDFSPIVTKIRQSGADAIFFFAAGPPVQGFLSAIQAAGVKTPILGGYGTVAADLSSFPKSLLEQVVQPTALPQVLGANGQPLAPGYLKIDEILWKKYGKSFTAGGGVAWDLTQDALWAMKQAKGDDPVKMRAALESAHGSHCLTFGDPKVPFCFSPTNHGGYPQSGIAMINLVSSPQYPAFFYAAKG